MTALMSCAEVRQADGDTVDQILGVGKTPANPFLHV